jgi:hypothetical protein
MKEYSILKLRERCKAHINITSEEVTLSLALAWTGEAVEPAEELEAGFPLAHWSKRSECTRRMPQVLRSMHTPRTKTSDTDQLWKTVSIVAFLPSASAFFARDRLNGDANCGIFGVFDGHGGRQVADHCAERVPEEMRKEIAKTAGDLSYGLEQVFLRVSYITQVHC